jgi:hypothetical protein
MASVLPLLVVLVVQTSGSVNPSVAVRLTCVGRRVYEKRATPPFLNRSSSADLGLRFENFRVHPNGLVTLTVDLLEVGSISCEAELTAKRVAALRRELEKTKFWRLSAAKSSTGREAERLYIDLGNGRRCDVEMSPTPWARSATARDIQAVIERLKSEVCEGACPEPRTTRSNETRH